MSKRRPPHHISKTAGDTHIGVHFVVASGTLEHKFKIGDEVLLRNGQKDVIIGTQYGSFYLNKYPGKLFDPSVLKPVPK